MNYIPGDFWRICDMSGFKVRSSQTAKQWNGLIVRDSDFEERHPQDFVRGRKDRQSVPDPRPENPDTFYGPLETLTTAAASAGSNSLTVSSTVRWSAGDHFHVMLSSGSAHRGIVQSVPGTTTLTLTDGLSGGVESGALVVNLSAVSEPDIG